MNPLEITGVAFGIAFVWLAIREHPWCWPAGLVNVLIFAVLFWRVRLFGSAGLQLVYAALAVYGWYAWLHGGADHGALRVSRVPRAVLVWLLAAGAAAALVLGVVLRQAGAALPMIDAAATAFSLVAQALQTRKWIENWVAWVIVDAVFVAEYASQGLAVTSGLYVVYTVMAALGWRAWRRSMAGAATA